MESSSSRKKRRQQTKSSSSEDSYSSDESSVSGDSGSSESDSESDERHHKSSSSSKKKGRRDSHKKDRHSKHRRHSDSTKDKTKHKKKEKKEKKEKKKSSSSKQVEISEADYFLKSSEFRKWLSQERGVFFSDLDSTNSRNLFKKFVSKWNSGRLKPKYYKLVQSSSLDHSSQTTYKWKFSGEEQKSLKSMKKMVSSWNAPDEADEEDRGDRIKSQPQPKGTGPCPGPSKEMESAPVIGPMLPSMMVPSMQSSDPFDEEERRESEKKKLQKDRKEYRKHKEMVLDELLPKATGKEARFEKKRIRSEQKREREVSPDIGDSSLMGTSRSIHDRIKARQSNRQNRAQAAALKVSDYEAKEKARVNAILEMAKANKKEGSLW